MTIRLTAGVYWVPYVPEVDRYGGPAGLAVAESHFRVSSDLCLELIQGIYEGSLGREAMGIAATVVLLSALIGDRRAAADVCRICTFGQVKPGADQLRWMQWLESECEAALEKQPPVLLKQVAVLWAAVGQEVLLTFTPT